MSREVWSIQLPLLSNTLPECCAPHPPVTNITGMSSVAGEALSSLQTSRSFLTGIFTSRRIRSGCIETHFSSTRVLLHTNSVIAVSASMVDITRALISSSSTIRTRHRFISLSSNAACCETKVFIIWLPLGIVEIASGSSLTMS